MSFHLCARPSIRLARECFTLCSSNTRDDSIPIYLLYSDSFVRDESNSLLITQSCPENDSHSSSAICFPEISTIFFAPFPTRFSPDMNFRTPGNTPDYSRRPRLLASLIVKLCDCRVLLINQ